MRRDTYELLIMCWEEKQKTPIHSFDWCEGWCYVIDGELNEDLHSISQGNAFASKIIHSNKINKGTSSYLHDEMGFHRYTNTNSGRTISLHLFSKPINEWVIFNEETKSIEKQHIKTNSTNILS